MEDRDLEVAALCDGAATLTQTGNRIASLALLWAAVGIAPTHFRAHRNLAAALANSGDVDAAGEEYARYVEFMLRGGEFRRAAVELVYARSAIGEHAALRKVGEAMIPLAAVAETIALPFPAAPSLPARPLAPTLSERPAIEAVERPQARGSGARDRLIRLATAAAMTVLAMVTLTNVVALAAVAH